MTDRNSQTSKGSPRQERTPLGVSCLHAECGDNLHCFRTTKKLRLQNKVGRCRYCDADLIDWTRVHRKDLTDVGFTFSQMKREWVRHRMWHVDIDQGAMNHARRKGRILLRPFIEKQLRARVGDEQPIRDGRQTPWTGNVVNYAQHATASCCRACIEEWHGIPQGRALTGAELEYLGKLAWLFIEERIPQLTENGEAIPRRRSTVAVGS